MKIYVVFGTTGEYSDHREWPVASFEEQVLAERLVAAASARANEIHSDPRNRYSCPKGSNQFDPEMEVDYTGTRYYFEEVDLHDSWPFVGDSAPKPAG